MHQKNGPAAKFVDRQQEIGERNHRAVADQHHEAQQGEQQVGKPQEREERNQGFGTGGVVGRQKDSIAGRYEAREDDAVETHHQPYKRDRDDEPDREPVAAIIVVEFLGKDAVEHGLHLRGCHKELWLAFRLGRAWLYISVDNSHGHDTLRQEHDPRRQDRRFQGATQRCLS